MNKLMKNGLLFLIGSAFLSMQTWAQDKGVDVDINVNKKDSNWYQQPWVWIIGGAVFILLLVALLRGSGKKE
jgi:hypothetical protein